MKTLRISLFLIIILFSSKISALYLLVPEGPIPIEAKRNAYHEILLKHDYPMCLMQSQLPLCEYELNAKLKTIHPRLHAIWVPTAQFQLFSLHYYFTNSEFKEYVQKLGYGYFFYDKTDQIETEKFKTFWKGKMDEPFSDDHVIAVLSEPTKTKEDLYQVYEKINHDEEMCTFFLKVNDAFIKSYSQKQIDNLLNSIPKDLSTWESSRFPFQYCSSCDDNIKLLVQLFNKGHEKIRRLIGAEWYAHEQNKHLVYRGANLIHYQSKSGELLPIIFLPLKGNHLDSIHYLTGNDSSFSLSYANSFLGGVFLCTDSCAARYAETMEAEPYVFHALKLGQNELIDDTLFCIPPFHPFVEMLVNGEWMHPHTKIAQNINDLNCYGWYAKINRSFQDYKGFLIRNDCSPQELAIKLLRLSAQQSIIFDLIPKDFKISPLDNYRVIEDVELKECI